MRHIKSIVIDIIPHSQQRYKTVGDYFFDINNCLHIKVSEMSNNKFELLVVIHELIEVLQTENDNIPEVDIAAFDIDFESKRLEGNIDEPGDDPKAPYKKQHCIATAVERLMAGMLDVDWKEYEKECNSL